MSGLIKRIAHFIVFRNVFIAIAAVCLVAESRLLSNIEWKTVDSFIIFTFFSTFLIYNFHSFSNDSETEFSLPRIIKDFVNPAISIEQRVCVGIGIVTTLISFLFLKSKVMLFLIPAGLITMAYSLPVFRIGNRMRGLRDIIYVKIFTVALVWSVLTVLLPYLNDDNHASLSFFVLILTERFLFIYAITIPFEIRDRHGEKAVGNLTIPIVYGVEKSKMVGYVVLTLYCIVVLIREFMFNSSPTVSMWHLVALFISAASAAWLIYETNDQRSKWYYKFLIDGTMIEQFFLLILLQQLC